MSAATTAVSRASAPQWDAETVKQAVVQQLPAVLRHLGVKVTGKTSASGYVECHAFDREDAKPSAGFSRETAVYVDQAGERPLSVFEFAVANRTYADFNTAVNSLGELLGVPPKSGVVDPARPRAIGQLPLPPENGPRLTPKPKTKSKGYASYPAAVEGSLRHVKDLEGYEVAREHRYSTANIIVRFEKFDDQGRRLGKQVRPFNQGDDGRWRSCKSDKPYPLYGQASIPETGVTIYVEGEKCQEITTEELNLAAVCCAFSKPNLSDHGVLAGREVAIIKDEGKAGTAFANKLAETLLALTPPARVQIISLPGLGDNEDIEQFIGCHGAEKAHAAILDLIAKTPCISTDRPTIEAKKRPRVDGDESAGFSNYHLDQVTEVAKVSYVATPHDIGTISKDLESLAPGWPKRVRDTLFVASKDYDPVYLGSATRLFAWLDQRSHVDWGKGTRYVTQERFYEHLRMTAESFDTIEIMPHTPRMAGAYYMHRDLPTATGKIDELVDYFSPASDVDREFIKAAIITPSWGGSPGSRPAFLITGEDGDDQQGRGLGKTTLVDLIADELYGGSLSVSPNEEIALVKTRLFSPEGANIRILRLDNVKTLRFSWADLEDFISATSISGKALYQGEGRRPNAFVWFITLNGASLSKDMAQRVVVVRLTRPVFSASWRDDVRRFIQENRWEILADIADLLSHKPGTLQPKTRWAAWERDILSKVDHAEECQAAMVERQGLIDEDNSDRDLIHEFIRERIRDNGYDPRTCLVMIPSALMAEWISTATRTNYPTNRATTFVKGLAIGELSQSRDKRQRGWVWRGPDTTDLEPATLSPQSPPEHHQRPHFAIARPY